VLWLVDVLAQAGERYRRYSLKAVNTVEAALRATAFAGASATALYSLYQGLYSEAVVSAVASAIAFAEAGQFKEAAECAKRAAEKLYEAAKEAFEKAKVALQRLVEIFVEAIARVLAWVDAHRAYLFLMAAVTAGLIALNAALDIYGWIELERLAYAALGVSVVPLADEYKKLREQHSDVLERLLSAGSPYEEFMNLVKDRDPEELPRPLQNLRRALASRKLRKAPEEKKNALVIATVALSRWLDENADLLREMFLAFEELREAWQRGSILCDGAIRFVKAREELLKAANELREELESLSAKYGLRELSVDGAEARQLAEATEHKLPDFSEASIGTKAYATVLGMIEGTLYGRIAATLLEAQQPADLLKWVPITAYTEAWEIGLKDVPKHEVRYLIAFMASLPPEMRDVLKGAVLVKSFESSERIVWELKTASGETLATLTFKRFESQGEMGQKRTGWVVVLEGGLAERLKPRLWEEEFEGRG